MLREKIEQYQIDRELSDVRAWLVKAIMWYGIRHGLKYDNIRDIDNPNYEHLSIRWGRAYSSVYVHIDDADGMLSKTTWYGDKISEYKLNGNSEFVAIPELVSLCGIIEDEITNMCPGIRIVTTLTVCERCLHLYGCKKVDDLYLCCECEEKHIREREALLLQQEQEYDARRKEVLEERAKLKPSLRYTILRRDNFRCKYCGRCADDGVKLHIDHIIPVSKGGLTIEDNLQTLCQDCNMGKSDR
jgi:5-methylcytosine-specific restriction endonuclease McrA